MKLFEIINILEELSPLCLQESYDNSGLLLGDINKEVGKALICFDLTEKVMDEAISNNYDLIISHHPIIFSPLKRINGSNMRERIIIKSIKNDISVLAFHTNLDNSPLGVNRALGDKLGVKNAEILKKSAIMNEDFEETGAGMIGYLEKEYSLEDYLLHIKKTMNLSSIKFHKAHSRTIEKVAYCGGSGAFLISEAMAQKADLFISGDIKYHEFFDDNEHMNIADIGHFESEIYSCEIIIDFLTKKIPNFAVCISDNIENPLKYL